MTLKECIELGKEHGCHTLRECLCMVSNPTLIDDELKEDLDACDWDLDARIM
jgi:hypothetical protein